MKKGDAIPNDDAMVNVHIENVHSKFPITLVHLLWINLYEHKIVTMNQCFPQQIKLSSCKFTKCVHATKYSL